MHTCCVCGNQVTSSECYHDETYVACHGCILTVIKNEGLEDLSEQELEDISLPQLAGMTLVSQRSVPKGYSLVSAI